MTPIHPPHTVIVHEGAGPLSDDVLRLLDGWLPAQRWYPVPGDGVRHVPWLTVGFPAAPAVVVPLLRLAGPGLAQDESALVIQVPLVLEHVPQDPERARSDGLIGVVDTDDGAVGIYDGGTHPASWHAYLRAALPGHSTNSGQSAGPSRRGGDPDQPAVRQGTGVQDTWGAPESLDGARALGGEQSNTSVLVPGLRPSVPGCPGEHADGVMLKILRTVPAGPHPDVVVPEALTRAGWDGVPRFLGAIELPVPAAGSGPEGASPGSFPSGDREAQAHLAVVSELITGADDGFELACAYAQVGNDFGEHAAELGAVVAQMHTALARARPTDATLDPSAFMGVLRRRAAEAIADVPGLAPHRAGITTFYDDVSSHLAHVTADHPVPLQAIHGDLHLGQVLHTPSGWKVLDFEGEPQRPVAERTAPDLPLRDVAGLLRSFDYAAVVGETTDPEWAARAQLSFLEGYREALDAPGALDVTTAMLLVRALTLDKALYEVVYEARHRPAWLHIPLRAVARVLEG